MLNSANTSFSLDPNLLHYQQITITGSLHSTPLMLHQAAELVASKEIDMSKIISHSYLLQDVEIAISATEN
jgi:L-iditol 2-dehydrogenase